jgi:hypothetical protein
MRARAAELKIHLLGAVYLQVGPQPSDPRAGCLHQVGGLINLPGDLLPAGCLWRELASAPGAETRRIYLAICAGDFPHCRSPAQQRNNHRECGQPSRPL